MRPASWSSQKPLRTAVSHVTAATVLGVCLALVSSPSLAEKPAPGPKTPNVKDKTAGACTQITPSVISEAFGYKHVVTLRNSCDKPVECQVWTDVDPTPRQVVRAEKGESVEIITRIGSPATEFKAFKECRLL
jgi:hypothetical protein